MARVSDDFYPRDTPSHTYHIAAVAFNSVFMGEIVNADWDMFNSKHAAAGIHAAARAVGGCAVYTSDKPGEGELAQAVTQTTASHFCLQPEPTDPTVCLLPWP